MRLSDLESYSAPNESGRPGVAAERRDEIAVNHPGTEPETAPADVQPVVEMFTQELLG